MNILVDTQVVLWAQTDNANLSRTASALLADDRHFKWVSSVSMIKIAIKHKIGKLSLLDLTPAEFFVQLRIDGYRFLPLTAEQVSAYDQLLLYQEHRDPFDRLILAVALHEGWPVMSADRKFSWYQDQIEILW